MEIYVVFDGPPAPESGRFIEVEDGQGHGVQSGAEWKQREDGYWELGPFTTVGERLSDRERAALLCVARERMVDRTGAAWEETSLRHFTEDEWNALADKLGGDLHEAAVLLGTG